LRHDIELEAFLKTEQRLGGSSLIRAVEQDSSGTVTDELGKVNDTILELKKIMSTITQELRELKERDRKQTTDQKFNRNVDWRKDIECYKCGKKGHMQKDCRSTTVRRIRAAPSHSQNTSGKTKTISSQNLQGKVSVSGEGAYLLKATSMRSNFYI
jgi:hypothetical protein